MSSKEFQLPSDCRASHRVDMAFNILKNMSFILVVFMAKAAVDTIPTAAAAVNSTDEALSCSTTGCSPPERLCCANMYCNTATNQCYNSLATDGLDTENLGCSTTGCSPPERQCCANMYCNTATNQCYNALATDGVATENIGCSTTGCSLPLRPCCANMYCNEATGQCYNN